MTIFILVHCDGKFLTGTNGIYYSKEPINSFIVDDNTSIWDLKYMIYECNGYDPERWNLLYMQLNASGTMIIELYVKRVPKESGVGSFG